MKWYAQVNATANGIAACTCSGAHCTRAIVYVISIATPGIQNEQARVEQLLAGGGVQIATNYFVTKR